MSYIAFIQQDALYSARAEFPGTFTIGSGNRDDIRVKALGDSQIILRGSRKGELTVQGKGALSFSRENVQKDSLVSLDPEGRAALYVTDGEGPVAERLRLPLDGVIRFGRREQNDVCIKNPYVSGQHFQMHCREGIFWVEDSGSTYGLYVNGRRVIRANVRSGDVISILHINIILENNELLFENVGTGLCIRDRAGDAFIGGAAKAEEGGGLKYRRSPRTQEELPGEPILLANPPQAGGQTGIRRGLFASAVGTGAMFAANLATGGLASPALLAARAASLVAPVTSIAAQTGATREERKKREAYDRQRMEKYGRYMAEQKARIEAVADKQRKIISQENPPAAKCLESLENLQRSLWERSPLDRDFLHVRLGMGYEDLCVEVKYRADQGFTMENDRLELLAAQIVEETAIVDQVPARVNLRSYQRVGIVGGRQRVIEQVRNLLVCLTTAHSFSDVRIVGIFRKEEEHQFSSLRWLPHVWDDAGKGRYLSFERGQTHRLCEAFLPLLRERRGREGLPHYIFILGSREDVQDEEIMQYLAEGEPPCGVSVLYLFDDLYSLPHNCQFIIDVDNGPCGFRKDKVNNKFIYTPDAPVAPEAFDSYCRTMSAIELEGFATAAELPEGIGFLEGFGVKRVEELEAYERWTGNLPYKSLAAPIGSLGGGKTFSLDIHERAHGPHGLVAGTTGSGKSETLQSWILSMAVNYHPHDVVFVLIDYKGGGMANLLTELPNVVGKITNISSGIGRSLISLQAEMKRRQRIFDACKEYQVNHIDKYQRLYREGKAKEPLPHLVIVADEFAELRKQEPEFMAGLVSASRIGRSLGIHLVLATQKPSGVVDDQIQSNSNFRLCLKVQDAADSKEMIRRPDAARITQPGRGFIRVGEDVVFQEFQSFWSGAAYGGQEPPSGKTGDHGANPICLVAMDGTRMRIVEEPLVARPDRDELSAVRDYLREVAREKGIEKLPGPWLEDLPEKLSLEELLEGRCAAFDGRAWPEEGLPWMKIPIGMYDCPEEQSQGTLYLDLPGQGHTAIYGAPGTGKTTMLKSIVWALCQCFSPGEAVVYILDCGGWSMKGLEGLPHVGGVALSSEEEKMRKTAPLILEEMEARKRKFLEQGVSSISSYRETGAEPMPAILLVVDNVTALTEAYPEMERLLATVAGQGASYGVYLICTAASPGGIRFRIASGMKNAISFELAEKGDYVSAVGRLSGKSLPPVRGRGFIRGNPPLEFQAALPFPEETEARQTARIRAVAKTMAEAWKGRGPRGIPVMPERISFRELEPERFPGHCIPLGIRYGDLAPAVVDLGEGYCFLITGPDRSAVSGFLKALEGMLRQRRPGDRICLLGPGEGEGTASRLEEIIGELNARKKAQNRARREAAEDGAEFSPREFLNSCEQIIILIEDLKGLSEALGEEDRSALERICRQAQGLGVLVIAAGSREDIAGLCAADALTAAILSSGKALGLGGNADSHVFLMGEPEEGQGKADLAEGDGYLLDGGRWARIRLAAAETGSD